MAFDILKYESASPSAGRSKRSLIEAEGNVLLGLSKQFGKQITKGREAAILESQKAAKADIIQGKIDPQRQETDAAYSATLLRNDLHNTTKSLHAALDDPASDVSNMNPDDFKKMLQSESKTFYDKNSKHIHSKTNAMVFSQYTFANQDGVIAKQAKMYKDNMKVKQHNAAVAALTDLPPGEGDPFDLNTAILLEDMLPPDRYTTDERRGAILGAARGAAGTGDRRLLDYAIKYYDADALNPIKVQQIENAFSDAQAEKENNAWMGAYNQRDEHAYNGEYTPEMYAEDMNEPEMIKRWGRHTMKNWRRTSDNAHDGALNYAEGVSLFRAGYPLSSYTEADRQQIFKDEKRAAIENNPEDPLKAMQEYTVLMSKQGSVDKELKHDLSARLLQPTYTLEQVKDQGFQDAIVMVNTLAKELTPSQMIDQVGEEAWDQAILWNNTMSLVNGDPDATAERFVAIQNHLKDMEQTGGTGSSTATLGSGIDRRAVDDALQELIVGDESDPNSRFFFGLRSASGDAILTQEINRELTTRINHLVNNRGYSPEAAIEHAKNTLKPKIKTLGNERHFTDGVSFNSIMGLNPGLPEDAAVDAFEHFCDEADIDSDKVHLDVSGNMARLLDENGEPFDDAPMFPMSLMGDMYESKMMEESAEEDARNLEDKLHKIANGNRKFGNVIMDKAHGNERLAFLKDGTTIAQYKDADTDNQLIMRKQYQSEKTAWIRKMWAPMQKWWEGLSPEGAAKWDTIRTFQTGGEPDAAIPGTSRDTRTLLKENKEIKGMKLERSKREKLAASHTGIDPTVIPEQTTNTKIDKQIQAHEGFRGKPYKDSVGVETVGYGRNLEANPITPAEWTEIGGERDLKAVPLTKDEALVLYKNDKARALQAIDELGGNTLPEEKQGILIDMAFNLGKTGLEGFSGMWGALRQSPPDYKRAAEEMRWSNPDDHSKGNTLWWNQVGNRAQKLYNRMKKG